MKLPAEGSALVNSATVEASSATASAAARIVSGAATLAVAAMTPNPKWKSIPGPMFATVEAVTSAVPSCPDSRWSWSVLWLTSPRIRRLPP